MCSEELKIESFMAQLSKHEADIRYWLTWDDDPQRVETVNELIKLPYEDEDDEAFISQIEKEGFSKDTDYYGFLSLRILYRLRENIFPEKYLPANYVLWLMNLSFLAAYAMGRFYGSLESQMKNLRIGPPETLEQLSEFGKHFLHHGKPKGERPQTITIREAYNSFYDRTKEHPSWKQLYDEWKGLCKRKGSEVKDVRLKDSVLYYKLAGNDKECNFTVNHFKNLRSRFEVEKIVMLTGKS